MFETYLRNILGHSLDPIQNLVTRLTCVEDIAKIWMRIILQFSYLTSKQRTQEIRSGFEERSNPVSSPELRACKAEITCMTNHELTL